MAGRLADVRFGKGSNIHIHFPKVADKLIPVGEFRRTTLAEYRKVALD